MSDDRWFSPNHVPPLIAPAQKRREAVWELRKNNRTYRGELLFHGEYGVEAQIFSDEHILYGRRYDTRELALSEAEKCRRQIEADSWPQLTEDLEPFL